MQRILRPLVAAVGLAHSPALSFAPPFHGRIHEKGIRPTGTGLNMAPTAAAAATLTEETTWRLRFVLDRVPTSRGNTLKDRAFVVEAKFLEEEGYEPPQGSVRQDVSGDDDAGGKSTSRFEISKGRWQLSEDPEDRKDGLWIWGLFKEPLYPFLLLQIETKEMALPSSSSGDAAGDGDGENKGAVDTVPPMKLYAKIPHKRDAEVGAMLQGSATLSLRSIETINVDPFGGATADIYDDVSIGEISVQPIVDTKLKESRV